MILYFSISDVSAVIYDTATTNVSNTYDTTSGTFTAPLEETYVFHFHALRHDYEVNSTVFDKIAIKYKLKCLNTYNYYKQAIRSWTGKVVHP